MRGRLLFGLITIGTLYVLGLSRNQQERISPDLGAIAGHVLSADGHPLFKFKVYAAIIGPPLPSRLPTTYTDESGRFVLDAILPGAYVLYSAKEDDGYADTFSALFDHNHEAVPEVTVHAGRITEGVVIKRGPRAPKLIGRIVDAITGEPVENATVTLYRADNPKLYVSSGPNRPGGQFEFLVPSRGLRIKVFSAGYESWYYGKDGSEKAAEILSVSPHTFTEIVIPLRPARKAGHEEP